jgi:serine protease Do
MTESATQIIIRHQSGSKTNQIEQFNLEGLNEISLGRDPANTISFDPQRDDAVSRKHAVIRIKHDKELYFRLADLNSSNGTLLNGDRISGEVELLPDDLIELGQGGPKFTFDVQPRPANLPARTRQMSAIDATATRIVGSTEIPETTQVAAYETSQRTAVSDPSTMGKVSVGKATILRMMSEERGKARQIWIGALAAVVLLAVIGGTALYMHSQSQANLLAQQLAEQEKIAAANKLQAEESLQKQMGISPAEIKRLGEATVYIRNQWQLYDRQTNRPVYQKMANVDGEWLPCYVRMDDGSIVRWLTLDNDRDSNYAQVGGGGNGSGFVIGEQGFILTNKFIVAGWSSPYEDFSSNGGARGAVYNFEGRGGRYPTKQGVNLDQLTNWVPDGGGWLFEANRPFAISGDSREFFGRNELLTVQFPGTRVDINASLVRQSIEADVAEIKIDVGQPLSKLDLAYDYTVQVGEKVILLGYSAVSNKTHARQETNEGGMVRTQDVYIPEPTVTEGVVSLLPTNKDKQASTDVKTYDTVGNTYQLDIYAGPGSSGGPVLNSAGKVIALDSLKSNSAQHVAFAVPISYVHELLQPQRNAQ